MGDIDQIMEPKPLADHAGSRASLFEVLMFLERRGASEATIELAMRRAGIHGEVARLLSRCKGSAAYTGTAAIEQPEHPADSKTTIDSTGRSSELALRHIITGAWMIFLTLGVGVALGVAVGYEFGLYYGFEEGLARVFHQIAE